jgi:hypothetical protein
MTLSRMPRALLHLEGLAAFGGALALYLHLDYSVLALVLLFLVPDLSFAAYAAGPKIGAVTYDAVHTSAFPIALGAVGAITGESTLVQVALIWLAHIGIDRALGYGLKYPTGFKDTHLNRV